jgi:CBS domain-containing protein
VNIRDVMTPDIDVVTPEDTLKTAAELLAELDLEALPVSENNRLVGVITSRDIAMRVAADGCNPKEVRVGHAMTGEMFYCFADESIADVAQKMAEWWVRRLPVVNHDKRPIGTVSLADMEALRAAAPREVEMSSRRLQAASSKRRIRYGRRVAVAA